MESLRGVAKSALTHRMTWGEPHHALDLSAHICDTGTVSLRKERELKSGSLLLKCAFPLGPQEPGTPRRLAARVGLSLPPCQHPQRKTQSELCLPSERTLVQQK